MAHSYSNIHGRRPTRGLRPWLLIPKVLAVGVYLGGLVALLVICRDVDQRYYDQAGVVLAEADCRLIEHTLFYVVDAGAGVATILGALLFTQHPRQFFRLRWWQVKMVSLGIGTPLVNLCTLHWLGELRRSVGLRDPWPVEHLEPWVWVAIGLAVWLIILGRLKPRLGQNWARDYDASRSPQPPRSPGTHDEKQA